MKNQLLETLLKIQKKIQKTKDNSIPELLEKNREEINFIKSIFNIDDVETLLLATCCIISISDSDFVFGIDTMSYFLAINNLELLLYQNNLQNLINKNLLSESVTQSSTFGKTEKSIFPIFNKEFQLHPLIAKHFI